MKQSIAQAVASVQNAPGSMYTREDVISLLNRIEVKGGGPTAKQLKDLIEAVYQNVKDNADNLTTEDVVDTYSAEFELSGNEISLSSVDIDTDKIADTVVSGIADTIEEFFEALEVEDDDDEEDRGEWGRKEGDLVELERG